MNRSLLFLAAAAALALAALIPGSTGAPPKAAPADRPTHAILLPDGQTLPLLPKDAVTRPTLVSEQPGPARLEGKLASTHVLGHRSVTHAWLRVKAVEAASPPLGARGPVAMVAVIDRSGSMAGEKLEDARRAARELVRRMGDDDVLGLVHYGSDTVAFPAVRVGTHRRELARFIDAVASEGGTNLHAALEAGWQVLSAVEGQFVSRRLMLLSDGQPTEGNTSATAILEKAGSIRDQGGAVSALGIGRDFNGALMQGIAQRGGGYFAYLPQGGALAEIFHQELEQASKVVVANARLTLIPSRGLRIREVYGYPAFATHDGVWVSLYDLTPGKWARLLVELQVDVPELNGEVGLTATVQYHDRVRAVPAEAAVRLTAQVTGDEQVVARGLDREVHSDALRAIGGKQIQLAAVAAERGDKRRALDLFGNVRKLYGASAEALAGDLQRLDRDATSLADSQDLADESKRIVRKNLSNFGVNNAY